MTVAATAGTRRPRFDLLTLLWFLVTCGVWMLHGFDGAITRDSSFYVYAGQRVAEGAAPYVELMNRAGPLAHLLPGAGVLLGRWTGVEDVYGVRYLFFAIAAAAPAITYALARSAFASRLAGCAAATAMLSFTGFAAFASTGPQSKSPIVTFLLWALLLMAQRRWFAAGVLTGIATLTWQPVLFAAAPAALVGCLLLPGAREKVSSLLRYALGGLLTLVVTAVYFALKGALEIFWIGFVLANAKYTEQPGAYKSWQKSWDLFYEGYGWTSWIWVAGAVLLVVGAIVAMLPRFRDDTGRQVRTSTLEIFAGFVGGAGWTIGVYNGWADAFMLLPFGALGIGVLVAALLGRRTEEVRVLRKLLHAPRTMAVTAAVAVWALVITGCTAYTMVDTREHELRQQIRASQALFDAMPDDFRAMSIHAPQPFALTGNKSASRFQLFTNGMERYVDDTWPGGLDGYVEWVREDPPQIVTTNGRAPEMIWKDLREEYFLIGRMEGAWILVHMSVDREDRRAIRDAALDEVGAAYHGGE